MFKQQIYKFSHSVFIRNTLILFTGTAIAQIIPLAIAPILSRIFSSGDFGIWALYVNTTALVAVIATARYELTIVLPKDDEDALQLVFLSFLIAVLTSFLSLILVVIFKNKILNIIHSRELGKWIYLMPLSIFLTGIFNTINYWFNRLNKFRILSYSKISKNGTIAGVNLITGYTKMGSSGLIVSQVTGETLSSLYLGQLFVKSNKGKLKLFSFSKIKQLAKNYIDYPLINSIQAFADQLRETGFTYIINVFFTNSILGLFVFGSRVVRTPLGLISYSLSQVFLQKIAYKHSHSEKFAYIVISLMKRLLLLSLLIFIPMFFLVEPLFLILFGKSWLVAGTYIKIMFPYIGLSFISSPLSSLPLILNKQRMNLLIGLIYNTSILFTLFISSYFLRNIKTALIFTSLIGSINIIIALFWYLRISIKHDQWLEKS